MKKLSLMLLCLMTANTWAAGNYIKATDFISGVFAGNPPKAKMMWLRKAIKPTVKEILGHRYPALRVRYWVVDKKSAWVLEEIGKEKLITVGLVIDNHVIQQVKVLAFRESRGWEVKHAFFTDQFSGAVLSENLELSVPIDGITGATLSVRALKKLARLALYFDQKVVKQ